ncbi:MAG: preprotein translocase subunit YajC [Actinomycetes bacterium]
MDGLANTFILVAFFGIMYMVLIRPQQKRQKQHQSMLRALTVGDDVVTIGGLHGTVVALTDLHVDLEVTDDVVLRFQRSAIAKVVTDAEAADVVAGLDEDDDA